MSCNPYSGCLMHLVMYVFFFRLQSSLSRLQDWRNDSCVLHLQPWLLKTATCGCFKKTGSPWSSTGMAVWRLQISHTETRRSIPQEAEAAGVDSRSGYGRPSPLRYSIRGAMGPNMDQVTFSPKERLDQFVSPLLLKTCKSPTSEQSHWPLTHLSQIVTVWARQHYLKRELSWNSSSSPSTLL